MVFRNEMYTIVGMINVSRYSLVFQLITEEVHKRTAWRCEPREHSPNSLGRLDNHKINFVHRQLHPSMIGVIDLLDYSKDVGQSGMISPWADISTISEVDTNKYPNIKYDLFDFMQREFPNPALRFHCSNIKEYNDLLDRLVYRTYMDIYHHIPKDGEE